MDESKLSPMMRQYLDSKKEYPDALLFYRIGDFYEMFFDDALTASKELDLVLTGKDCGLPERAPMCGVPYHAADSYVSKLVSKGYKVAIGEQVEDPKKAKGLVKREIIKVITPGTQTEETALEEGKNNFLMSIYLGEKKRGIVTVDITTGECYATAVDSSKECLDEISRFSPKEILMNPSLKEEEELFSQINSRFSISLTEKEERFFSLTEADKLITAHFQSSIMGLGLSDQADLRRALGGCLSYLYDTQKNLLTHIRKIEYFQNKDYMIVDSYSQRNLELWETLREKKKRGTLLWVLDYTKTAMGSRMLRHFLERPLRDKKKIEARLDAVEEFTGRYIDMEELREYLDSIYDIERLLSRISLSTANARDLLALKLSLQYLPDIKKALLPFQSSLLSKMGEEMDSLEDIYRKIEEEIVEEPPLSVKEGGLIKASFSKDVEDYRNAGVNGKEWLQELEARERDKTGIKNLKIKYNRIFGYCFEVSKAYQGEIPDYFIRRQTLAQGERYITTELEELQNRILGAEEKLKDLEYALFCTLREEIAAELPRIQKTARELAHLDAYLSLAKLAIKENYVRPRLSEGGSLFIKEGRHPVVEKLLEEEQFIPNDTSLEENQEIAIITGPNMAGKSTYMRQVALIVLLSAIGSFVPAKEAELPICDRIFTRVGASDDLAQGQSTFMVEMSEVANILRNATKQSLLILDEIGRGTSTFDGLSIAWAVVEYIARHIQAKTLFATHYHELTELEGKLNNVKNYCIAVSKKDGEISFLRKIIPGGADESYGIDVAKLAGVPEGVLSRAREISAFLSDNDFMQENKNIVAKEGGLETDDNSGGYGKQAENGAFKKGESKNGESKRGTSGAKLLKSLNKLEEKPALTKGEEEVLRKLRSIIPEKISPFEACSLLFELKELLQ